MPSDNTVLLEGVRIIFRNFAGKEGMYNREGDRNFAVLLSPDEADQLSREGWNVKTTKDREADDGEIDPGEPYLPVSVGYKGRPPRVVMITSRGRTDLGQDEVEVLDYVDINNVDLIVRPYDWGPIRGETGRKAYVKSIYITINEDALEKKYGDVPNAGKAIVDREDPLSDD